MQILPFHEPPKVVDPFMFVPLKRNFVISKDDGVLDLDLFISILVGGLVAIFYFPIYWEKSSQLTNSYFSEGSNHQPVFIFIFFWYLVPLCHKNVEQLVESHLYFQGETGKSEGC